MSILVNKDTKLVVQGITGREGQFHTLRNKAYGTNVVAGVTPGKAGQDVDGIPVFNTVRDAVEATGANTSMIFVPPRFATDAIFESLDAGIDLTITITEGIPAHDMMRVYMDRTDLLARGLRHLFDADHQHDARAPRLDRGDALVDRRRSGGAGILDPRRRFETKRIIGLQHKRSREILLHESAAEMPHQDLVDVGRCEPCVGDGLHRHLTDEGFEIEPLALAEFSVRPTNDTGCHWNAPRRG